MTEDDARGWLAARYSAGQLDQLQRFVQILRVEAEHQSLIASSTFDTIWARHIVDSAQLLDHAQSDEPWLDIGSGGGLPGLVIGILRQGPITLCEPRRKRAEFLISTAHALGLMHVKVAPAKVQTLTAPFACITARAVAAIHDIFEWTAPSVSRGTRYLLQRGRNWQEDIAQAKRAWHGVFHVEQSITDADAAIVIAEEIRPR